MLVPNPTMEDLTTTTADGIDEVYVANRAFSEKEIQELMNSALPVEAQAKSPLTWAKLKSK